MKTEKEQLQLDQRTKEDIIQQMEELAYYYTPEWRFHSLNPDVGSALINLYGDMYMQMIRRYNLIPERDRLIFFEWLGTCQKAAQPAEGYVSFGIQKEAGEGVFLPVGTGLIGRTEQGERVKLQTKEDLYVSTSEIKSIFYCNGREDRIQCMAEGEGPLSNRNTPNLQEHVCRLGHSVVFSVHGEAEIVIILGLQREDWDRVIGNPELTEFSYSSEQGEWSFSEWSCQKNVVRLKKTKEMPDFAVTSVQKQDNHYIFWKAKNIQAYDGLEMNGIQIGTIGVKQSPERIYTAEGEEGGSRYYPFGERPYSYGEFYLCSDEVFGKRGAVIRLKLNIEFRRIPLLIEPIPLPIQWKAIMKQSDFMEEEAIPITINQVIWEYYNGVGFTKLFSEPFYGDIFTPEGEEKERSVTIELTCPMDIQPFFIYASNGYCIRARILRMNHDYVRTGYYLTPFITHVDLCYDYGEAMQEPELCICRNNLEERWVKAGQTIAPFWGLSEKRPTLYIGFDRVLNGGPFGLYCNVDWRRISQLERKWNYESYSGREWKGMMVEDHTNNLRKSGVLLVFDNEDTIPLRLFGIECYWIRLIAMEQMEERQQEEIPIREIWWNTVPIIAVETAPEEFFTVSGYEKNPMCQLKQKNIQEITVWVRERGIQSDTWVCWEERQNFYQSGAEDCHYRVNRKEGQIFFSDGKKGRLPERGLEKNVKVHYTWGGGSQGSLGPGLVCQMERATRFLNQVTNRYSLSGGREEETSEEAIERVSKQLRHHNRAVMLSDYEALAKEASRDVAKVKAFSNRNSNGERESGGITMVVLSKSFDEENFDFQCLKERIYDCLRERMPGILQLQNHLSIIEPWFTKIEVAAVCVLKPHTPAFACRIEAVERLRRFLNPLIGNFDGNGWGIGTAPRREQIRNALREISGVETIKKIVIKAYCWRNQRMWEIDLEDSIPAYMVVISGEHVIRLELS